MHPECEKDALDKSNYCKEHQKNMIDGSSVAMTGVSLGLGSLLTRLIGK